MQAFLKEDRSLTDGHSLCSNVNINKQRGFFFLKETMKCEESI